LIWFGILVVLVIEMGLITPPIGMNVFVVKSISQDIEISKIFQGVLPFILAMFFVLTALLVVPDIVLFLIE
ncbi:MAG TPA: TRAP transporter large permease, partial [Alphaproteobacteria bacterium]|nr:TRAP transporter large permease [Alphaproteobacteria bacterium]